MRLIDADALIESLSINPEDCPGCPEPEWLEELADILALAPTVDAIDRKAAIGALAKFVPYAICDESTESYTNGLTDAYNLILQLPSAQTEIIHCESCKHWKNEHICECLSRYGTFETPKNFYCGYGKEK